MVFTVCSCQEINCGWVVQAFLICPIANSPNKTKEESQRQ